jgi:tetratricopeptide (TPR) repeat protein
MRDLFRLQDDLARQVAESLSIRLSPRDDRRMKCDVPASPSAYEFYLRANQCAYDWKSTAVARDLYLQCVEQDPSDAPAWSRLARCYRILGKFGMETEENLHKAEQAFERALSLNPDLSLTHNLYAHLEADLGRGQQAMQRLLDRAKQYPNDAELFAGLVHVCRYCGLVNASVRAHERAQRIDPQVPTSVIHTYFLLGDYERTLKTGSDDISYVDGLALLMLGRNEELARRVRAYLESGAQKLHPRVVQFLRMLGLLAEGESDVALEVGRSIFTDFVDPEGRFYWARHLAQLGDVDKALRELQSVVSNGYFCGPALKKDAWFDPLRSRPEFAAILNDAEQRRSAAVAAFRNSGGPELLGVEEAE